MKTKKSNKKNKTNIFLLLCETAFSITYAPNYYFFLVCSLATSIVLYSEVWQHPFFLTFSQDFLPTAGLSYSLMKIGEF